MTNFLSPVDPIFFLHHSNMDRLWDIWTRKQIALGLKYLPTGAALKTLSDEEFLFFVKADGKFVGTSHAGDYLSTKRFDYDYEPGFGEEVVKPPSATLLQQHHRVSVKGEVKGAAASVGVPRAAVEEHLASAVASLMAEVTVERPHPESSMREYDVIIGAPADVTHVEADSPYYAGTIAFFGCMRHTMSTLHEATFTVPLPKKRQAFRGLDAAAAAVSVNIRVVPSTGHGSPSPLKALSVRSMQ
jgi:tyrosinase